MASRSAPQALRAVVLTAPAGPRSPLDVRLDSDQPDIPTQVDHWSPRGSLLPQPGDVCLVAPDDEGNLWLAEWEPRAMEPPPEGFDTAPIGSVMTWSGRSDPSAEYALANGQTLARDDFPDGYAFALAEEALGNPDWATTSTTFTVPNYVGRFLFHRDVQDQGTRDGAKTVTLTGAQSGVNGSAVLRGAGNSTPSATYGLTYQQTTAQTNVSGFTVARAADQAHNNMPPYVAVAMFVKVAGVTVDSGMIIGPSGSDGRDGAPGGALGHHVTGTTSATIPDLGGAAATWLVTSSLTIDLAGSAYATFDVTLTSGGGTLWAGSRTVSDIASTYLPIGVPLPQQVVTTAPGADLTVSTSIVGGYVAGTTLTATAYEALA